MVFMIIHFFLIICNTLFFQVLLGVKFVTEYHVLILNCSCFDTQMMYATREHHFVLKNYQFKWIFYTDNIHLKNHVAPWGLAPGVLYINVVGFVEASFKMMLSTQKTPYFRTKEHKLFLNSLYLLILYIQLGSQL